MHQHHTQPSLFEMILVFTFMSVFLLHSAAYDDICQESFSCPDFGPFEFPFYNTTDTQCGLIKINCSNQSIQLGEGSYDIIGKYFPGPSLSIQNTTLQKLVEAKSCKALVNSFTSPVPHLFSLSIKPLITLFKCPKDLLKPDGYFDQRGYNSHNTCKYHNFYYKHPISTTPVPSDLPYGCQVIRLPGRLQKSHANYTDIFSFLTYQFFISFEPPSCDQCHKNDSNCSQNHGKFQCSDAKNGKQEGRLATKHDQKLKLILVLSGSAFVFILMLSSVIFLISRCYKNNLFSSNDKSLNPEEGSLFFGVSVFTYMELEDATKHFDPSHELGDGGFGVVYYGKLQDGREVAVKRLYDNNYKRLQHFINEVEILTKLRHPHLVLLYGCTSQQSRELLLVYEYIPNGTVADHLHGEQANQGLLTWPIRMKIAIETASALVYLHASEIIHRDVKTNNILLNHNFSVKVADFGLSRLVPDNVTHVSTAPQGTPGYLDPQYHQCYQLTEKSDVYSFGVVLIELISSMAPLDLRRSQDEISLANLALNRIQRCAIDQLIDPVLGSYSNPEFKNMITSVAELAFRCLQFDSKMRPTMNEVLDVLMEIQAGKRMDAGDNICDLKAVNTSSPPEINDSLVLLKESPPSQISVASLWQSDSSASTTQSRNGDRLHMKNIPVIKPFNL